jgi:hypothetical protein
VKLVRVERKEAPNVNAVATSAAARTLGVRTHSLRRWEKEGLPVPAKRPGARDRRWAAVDLSAARVWIAKHKKERENAGSDTVGGARLEARALHRAAIKDNLAATSLLKSIQPTTRELETLWKITPPAQWPHIRAALNYRKAVLLEIEVLIAHEAKRNEKREQRRTTQQRDGRIRINREDRARRAGKV